jgi:transcriptional antiterminator RfaH
MSDWFVVYTQPSKEFAAEHHLRDQAFDVYVPCFKKIRRHARKVDEVLAPLFPRYIFARESESGIWRNMNGTRGVVHVLTSSNNHPCFLSDRLIQQLKSQENGDGLVHINSLAAFVKGERLEVLEGPFEGHSARFERFDDKQRVQVLLTFMEREMKLSLPSYVVRAA